jgi:preprotein translocase subunit YajC
MLSAGKCPVSLILPVVVLLVLAYFFMIRPQQRRAAEQRSLQEAAGVGAEVMLTSGIYGTIAARNDDHVLVTIADGVTIRVAPAAIGRVIPAPEPDTEPEIASAHESEPEPGDGAAASEES